MCYVYYVKTCTRATNNSYIFYRAFVSAVLLSQNCGHKAKNYVQVLGTYGILSCIYQSMWHSYIFCFEQFALKIHHLSLKYAVQTKPSFATDDSTKLFDSTEQEQVKSWTWPVFPQFALAGNHQYVCFALIFKVTDPVLAQDER